MIVTRTPLRLSFFGGGSDLPGYAAHNIGCVLSCTINKYVYIAVNRKFDGNIRVSYSRTENVASADLVENDRARECFRLAGITTGVEVVSVADVPGNGTGLGSSSAFTVGLLNALLTMSGCPYVTPIDLARAACEVEINRCNAPIGRQDQYASAIGGMQVLSFCRDGVSSLPLPVAGGLCRRLLLFYTGLSRDSSAILADQSQWALHDQQSSRVYGALVGTVGRGVAALLRSDWKEFGDTLDADWNIKRTLAEGITNPLIDDWYSAAKAAGAFGGKVCGAGGGGFMLFVAEPEKHADIKAALAELKCMPFCLTDKGSEVVFAD